MNDQDYDLLERADLLCDLRREAEAAAQVATVLAHDPHNLRAWLVLSRARLLADAPADALSAASTAITLAPGDATPHAMAGLALSDLHRHPEAVAALRRATSLEPDNARWHKTLADVLNAADLRPTEALLAARTALRLSPDEASVHVTHGTTLAANRNWAQAQDAFHRALSLDPQSAAAHHELARVNAAGRNPLASRKLADATTGLAAALRIDPHQQVSRQNLELVLRVFLIRTSVLLAIITMAATWLANGNQTGAARLLAVTGALAPAAFAYRFVHRLTPPVRTHLRDVLSTPRMRKVLACGLLAVCLLMTSAAMPTRWVWPCLFAAVVTAIFMRISVQNEADPHVRAPGARPTYHLGNITVGFIAVASALLALCGFAAGSHLAGTAIGAGFAALSAWCGYVIVARLRRA